jgi:hypothetical protein
MVYPLDANITWHSGFDSMTTYTFGKEKIAHSFCSTCGTSIGGKSTDATFFADNRAMNVSYRPACFWSLNILACTDPELCPSG